MKKINTPLLTCGLLGCAVMTSLAGDPAPYVHPTPSDSGMRGSIGITLGNTWLNGNAVGNSEDDEYLSGIVDFRLGWDIGSSFYVQGDLQGELTDVSSNTDDSYQYGWGVATHFMWNYSDCCSIGVFGGWFETDHDNDNTNTSERYIAGIEGLHQLGGLDLHWQVGGIYGNGGSDDNSNGNNGVDSLRDAYFGRVVASKDMGNGWRASVEASAVFGKMDRDRDDITIYGWGASVQKQLTPNWVMAIVYQGNAYDQDDPNSSVDSSRLTEHFVGINTTFYFGGGSSPEQGARTLDLPPVLRWMAITGGSLE